MDFFWYQCYYPHQLRDSLSPICRILKNLSGNIDNCSIMMYFLPKNWYSGRGWHWICGQNWRGKGRGRLVNADMADKGGRGFGEMLRLADKGRRRVLDPPILGIHNLWTAPYRLYQKEAGWRKIADIMVFNYQAPWPISHNVRVCVY